MKPGNLFIAFLITALLFPVSSPAEPSASREEIQTWMTYLSDDARQGRASGTPEMIETGNWLAQQFANLGLEPLPGQEDFFQHFSMEDPDSAEQTPGRNILGILPGTATGEDRHYLIISAHYDHIGTRSAADANANNSTDRIFNGANDNASGVAAMLGIAGYLERAIANDELARPTFSILFAAWDGEEKGLRGSGFFVSAPPIPLSSIDAMINLEMVGVTDGQYQNSLWLTGSEYSDLKARLQPALEADGWTVEADPFPDYSLFFRSDNAPFALGPDADRSALASALKEQRPVRFTGIPAHSISTWRGQDHYHKVKDELGLIDFENLENLVIALAGAIADLESGAIQWQSHPVFKFRRPTGEPHEAAAAASRE